MQPRPMAETSAEPSRRFSMTDRLFIGFSSKCITCGSGGAAAGNSARMNPNVKAVAIAAPALCACKPGQGDIFYRIYRSTRCRVTFDAQCDVAAVVYGAGEDPDGLLIGFADDLRRAGLRPVGVVQAGSSCRAESPRLGVVVLPGGDTVCRSPMRALVTRDVSSMPAGLPISPSALPPPSTKVPTS